MILFDASHTSHTRAQTGIQRVVRSLFDALDSSEPTTAVCFDPFQSDWRQLDAGELKTLRSRETSARSRGARWSVGRKFVGHARRITGRKSPMPRSTGAIFPELFSPAVAGNLDGIFAKVGGPRVALFHDAIGLKFPELTPPATVGRLPGYLRELLRFDGVAAVSEDSAESLRDFWMWLDIEETPPVHAIPLGLDAVDSSPPTEGDVPVVLCVATVEGRKNHLALLDACEKLWASGLRFELHLIGMARNDTGAAALERIGSLKSAGRPLTYRGAESQSALDAAYRRCAFTVYPSLIEGFGLPVLESLQHGRPCICSANGALGESTRGGGCIALDRVDTNSLLVAIEGLLRDPARRSSLAAAAKSRTFKSWSNYSAELVAWMAELPGRR